MQLRTETFVSLTRASALLVFACLAAPGPARAQDDASAPLYRAPSVGPCRDLLRLPSPASSLSGSAVPPTRVPLERELRAAIAREPVAVEQYLDLARCYLISGDGNRLGDVRL